MNLFDLVKRLEHQSLNRQRSMNNNSNDTEQTVIRRKIPKKETINETIEEPIPIPSPSIQTKSSSPWSINRLFLPFSLIM